MASRPIHVRYRLRTLLLAMLALGGGLGWWFRPLTLVKRWPSGEMQYELHVRRAWNGNLVTNGQQRWWWSNGELAREGDSFGKALPNSYEQLQLANEACWDRQGHPMAGGNFWIDWFVLEALQENRPIVEWSRYRYAETEHEP